MASSIINANGRTTIPASIRREVDARPGMRLRWHAALGGVLLVKIKHASAAAPAMAPRKER